VLILRDVLGFSARETAAALEMSSPGVDSALQRAHKAVDERLPDRSQQAVLGSLDDQGLREIVDRYVDAFERADVDAVVEMLAADGAFTMPPLPTWYRGREAVAAFLKGHVLASENRWRLVPARANGQVAFGNYRWDDEWQRFLPRSISVLTLDGEGIAEITTFLGPELLSSFGLPEEVPPGR
jgi:RNA polymerase sigma-70 factor (ECF subfamily)